MRYSDWDQRQMDIKMSEQMDREEAKREGKRRNETSEIPQDQNYFLSRLEGQLVRLAEVNTKGRHVYSDEDLHKEIASIISTAQSFATQLRQTFDRKRFDVA